MLLSLLLFLSPSREEISSLSLHPPAPAPSIPLSSLTVRGGTLLLQTAAANERLARQQTFVRLVWSLDHPNAGEPSQATLATSLSSLSSLFLTLWRLRWDNSPKEVYWRVVYNVILSPARLHLPDPSCRCSPVSPPCDLSHLFWSCPVAQVLRQEILRSLLPILPAVQLSYSSLWLMQSPHSSVPTWVWRAVCLAYFSALDHSRAIFAVIDLTAAPDHPRRRRRN